MAEANCSGPGDLATAPHRPGPARSGGPPFRSTRLYAMFDRPWIYEVAGRALALGAESALVARIRAELASAPAAGLVLDVGCGPRSWLSRAGLDPIGVDASLSYAVAQRRAGGRAVVARAEALPFHDTSFASVWSFGLLHHLSDDGARQALIEAHRVAAAGRVVIFDGVLPVRPIRRPVAWLIRRLDRGRFLRSEGALLDLLSTALFERGEDSPGRWRLSRLAYSRTGLEGLWCVFEPAGEGSY